MTVPILSSFNEDAAPSEWTKINVRAKTFAGKYSNLSQALVDEHKLVRCQQDLCVFLPRREPGGCTVHFGVLPRYKAQSLGHLALLGRPRKEACIEPLNPIAIRFLLK